MSDWIKEGDQVKVFFSTHPPIAGVVKHIPLATGDSWVIKTLSDDGLVYIQQFDYMVLQVSA